MTNRPRLLDLFCGAGGCSMGYHRAGFEVVGVDIKPQPHYPFTFIQADAMTYPLDGFDFIHASPPCQGYSTLNAIHKKVYPLLLVPMRARLQACGVPWIMENVKGAPMGYYMQMCGSLFGLKVIRHRQFETSFLLFSPGSCLHKGTVKNQDYLQITGHQRGSLADWQEAMGIDWMNKEELCQAIPPAYTEWIGKQWMDMFRNTRPSSNINQPGAA